MQHRPPVATYQDASVKATTRSAANPYRYDISKLAGPSVDENGKDTPKGRFQKLASKSAKEQWKVDGLIQEKWEVLRSALTDAAKSALGVEKRRQPDWFRDSANSLEPTLQKRNQLYLEVASAEISTYSAERGVRRAGP